MEWLLEMDGRFLLWLKETCAHPVFDKIMISVSALGNGGFLWIAIGVLFLLMGFKNKVWVGLEYFCNEQDKIWTDDSDTFIKFAIDEATKIGIFEKEDVIYLIKDVLNNPELLSKVANRSYTHALGFDKIVLMDLRKDVPKVSQKTQLRLHIWNPEKWH